MGTIVPEKIEIETVSVFHDEFGFIAAVNEYEFTDLRIKIKESNAEGYYVFKRGNKYYIDRNGCVAHWDFFGLFEQQLARLVDFDLPEPPRVFYVLMEDSDGTTFSLPSPTGQIVIDEDVAKVWVKKPSTAYGSRCYEKVVLVSEPK